MTRVELFDAETALRHHDAHDAVEHGSVRQRQRRRGVERRVIRLPVQLHGGRRRARHVEPYRDDTCEQLIQRLCL